MTAIIHWTPLEFCLAIPITFSLTLVLTGVSAEVAEFLQRRLVRWWTGEEPK